MKPWTFLALAAVAGCGAEPVRFQPATGGRGSAFYYDLERDGHKWGDVKVWIPGLYEREDEKPFVEVRFRVRNDGDQAVALDVPDTYAEVAVDGRWTRVRPEKPAAESVTVEPGKVEELALVFPLPAKEVDEIEVNWTARWTSGRMTRSSVFLAARYDRHVYYGPYYGMGMRYGYPYWPHRYWDDPFWP
ncbi:MAG TPA: hypothetical protein VF950_27995 [Planctomycetota bacterium]